MTTVDGSLQDQVRVQQQEIERLYVLIVRLLLADDDDARHEARRILERRLSG